MAVKNNLNEIIDTVFNGMDVFVKSKTVVGEPIKVGDATLIPLIEVSCGMGAGAFDNHKEKKAGDAGAAAVSSKMTPSAVLIMQNGNSKLINVKKQDMMTKLLDMLPEMVDKFTGGNRVSEESEKKANTILEQEK